MREWGPPKYSPLHLGRDRENCAKDWSNMFSRGQNWLSETVIDFAPAMEPLFKWRDSETDVSTGCKNEEAEAHHFFVRDIGGLMISKST